MKDTNTAYNYSQLQQLRLVHIVTRTPIARQHVGKQVPAKTYW
jgi:hypothetical protein